MILIMILAIALLFGCSSQPKHIAPNEINEPLLYPKNHVTIGTSLGTVWVKETHRDDFFGSSKDGTYSQGFYLEPAFSYEVNKSKWASYQIWPLYWKLLLTGDQFSDSLHLQVQKLNALIEGGVSGISYSSRDRFMISFAFAGRIKYLFNERVFNSTVVQFQMYNAKVPKNGITSLSTEIGSQLTEKNSLSLSYNWSYYNIPKYTSIIQNGISYSNDESSNELVLSHSLYFYRKHILGPEVSYEIKNLNYFENNLIKVGLHYLYNFD